MRIALQQEISRSDESRYDHRLHGVLLVGQGRSCYDVADWFGEHPTTIERWVHRFEQRGFAGLREGEREGRPRRLDDKTWEKLGRDLRLHPRDLGYEQNLWDGKLLSHHLRQRYATDLGVFHAPTRKSVALFGAVNLQGGQMMAHFNPMFEAQSFLAFLQGLLRRRARGRKMMLITDNAAYHRARGLAGWLRQHRDVLELLFLPPYSPELNPIERVWKLLRRLCTHNEYFPELELLENALTQQLSQWWRPNAVLRRLCCIT